MKLPNSPFDGPAPNVSTPDIISTDMGRRRLAVNARGRFATLLVLLATLLLAAFPQAAMSQSASATPGDRPIRIAAFGDSLTAGFGLPADAAFPVQLERALHGKGHAVTVINAGVSGDTTASALDRFDWAVPDDVDAVIVELGANDALRGLDPARARANLDAILTKLAARKLPVLVAGMSAPRNLGETYVTQFDRIHPELAKAHDAILYPFFLDGVALDPALNLGDGIHPTAAGIGVIVTRILPKVEELIARAATGRAGGARK